MPRHPRPKVLSTKRVRRSDLTIVPDVRHPVPPPPEGLLDKYTEQWNAFWSSPLVSVIVPELDTDTIETLFRLRDERERSLRAGRRKRLVNGSQGQPVLNPLLDYALKLQKDIRALEDRLAANPKARMVIGVLFGEAHRTLDDLNDDLDRDAGLDDILDDPDVLDGIG